MRAWLESIKRAFLEKRQFYELCKPLDALSQWNFGLFDEKEMGSIQTEMKEGSLLHGALTVLS